MSRNALFTIMAAGTAVCIAASAAQAELNRSNVREGIAARVENTVEQMAGPSAGKVDIQAKNITLEQIEPAPVSIHDHKIPLYAVKASLDMSSIDIPGKDSSTIKMVVDDSGRLQVAVREIATGRSLIQEARDKISREKIAPELGRTIHSGDKGPEVVFASDPFCPYCRKAFNYFLDHRDSISEWRVVHLPYHKEYGGDAAIWAIRGAMKTVDTMDLMRFAYGDLKPVREGKSFEKKERVIRQFMDEFPALKDKWGSAEQARYYLMDKYKDKTQQEVEKVQQVGVRATPGVFIDGVRVKGWNPSRYDDLLGVEDGNKDRSRTPGGCS